MLLDPLCNVRALEAARFLNDIVTAERIRYNVFVGQFGLTGRDAAIDANPR
jgi:hypothetical protein